MAEPAEAAGINVVVEDDDNATRVDPVTGAIEIDQPDGGVVVQLNPQRDKAADDDDEDFFENLVEEIDPGLLNKIANDLYEAVDADDRSRSGKLQDIARGLDLLGLKLSQPRSDVADSSSPMDGMSSVTNPLLLEACLKGWANSQAELLPAEGPCKVENTATMETEGDGELAEAFETGMNTYLTVGAPEYYPDTSQMLLWGVYFSGSGIKKVYRCPIRRRPASDTVDTKDLIVSDTMKDFRACERITHQTLMRPSVMKRMKLLGEYRDQPLTPPTPQPNQVDEKIASIQGTQNNKDRPEDQPYTIWEIQCELDLEDYAPGKFKNKNIPLPFRVTMDKDSREILAIRRDWNPDDDECERKRLYVKYPYVPGPGFYGTGLLNILGNCSAAMTAAWRETLDAGMFANFPAGLISKLGGRQLTSDMRLSPAALKPIETNGLPIQQVVMGLPYKDITPGILQLMDKIISQAKEVGGTADIPAGEGLQNIPVGTMLANIEQATKVMAAAHKGMHQAQGEELRMIADLFRENPEDFWRSNKDAPKDYWDEQKLLMALDKCSLVPQSDPNVPSHIHRLMKAVALVQLIAMPVFTPKMDADETLARVLRALKEDPTGLVVKTPPQGPPPPSLGDQAKMLDAETKKGKLQLDAATTMQKSQDKVADNQSKEKVAALHLESEKVIHAADQQHQEKRLALDTGKHALDVAQATHDAVIDTHQALTQPPPAGGVGP